VAMTTDYLGGARIPKGVRCGCIKVFCIVRIALLAGDLMVMWLWDAKTNPSHNTTSDPIWTGATRPSCIEADHELIYVVI
jgi:hypothetical protein